MRLLHQATAIKDPPTSSLKDPTIADISTAMTNWLQGIIISFNTKTSNPGRKSKAQCQHQGSKSYLQALLPPIYIFDLLCFGKNFFYCHQPLLKFGQRFKSTADGVDPTRAATTPTGLPAPRRRIRMDSLLCMLLAKPISRNQISITSTFANCKLLHKHITTFFMTKIKISSFQVSLA